MVEYLQHIENLERIFLVFGVLSGIVVLIYAFKAYIERIERGLAPKTKDTSAVISVMGSFTVFSLVSFGMCRKGSEWYVAFPIGILSGLVYLIVVFIRFGKITRTETVSIDLTIAIGHIGVMYRPVTTDEPMGCASIDVFGKTIEAFAISSDNSQIASGTVVKVIDVSDDKLVCERVE